MPQELSIPSTQMRRRNESEKAELEKNVAKMRALGADFEEIGKELGVSKWTASRIFSGFIEKNRKEWLQNQPKIITEIYWNYRRKLQNAERRHQLALKDGKHSEAGFWDTRYSDYLKEFRSFLKECGYLGIESVKSISEGSKSTEEEPIVALIGSYKQHLKELVKNASKNA